jgi:glycosyltransferase involved in cell wall biosynthesis
MKYDSEQDYISKIKKLIKKYKSRKDKESVIELWETYCKVRHVFNSILVDDELEDDIVKFSMENVEEICIDSTNINPRKHIVFYDSVFSDTTVLSRQYLQGLIDLNINFTYIAQTHALISESTKLIRKAKECPRCRLVLLDNSSSRLQKIARIRKEILESRPLSILIQAATSDVTGIIALSNIIGVNRFFINHGDDQFWIGAREFEYYIHFSESVKKVANIARGIPNNKSLILKYYPVIEKEEFQGLPLEIRTDDFVIFSGGRFSKINDNDQTFLNIVKNILDQNKSVKFVFAGSGDDTVMRKFIDRYNFRDKWIVINYRSDLFELLKHVKIYLGTYPIKGGLMTQYAAYAAVPIVELNDFSGFRSEELFLFPEKLKITYDSSDDLLKEIDNLIDNEGYRNKISKQYENLLVTPKIFAENLERIISGDYHFCSSNSPCVNLEKIFRNNASGSYLNRRELDKAFINRLVIKNAPVLFFKSLIRYFISLNKFERKVIIKKAFVRMGIKNASN